MNHAPGYKLFLTETEVVLTLRRGDGKQARATAAVDAPGLTAAPPHRTRSGIVRKILSRKAGKSEKWPYFRAFCCVAQPPGGAAQPLGDRAQSLRGHAQRLRQPAQPLSAPAWSLSVHARSLRSLAQS